jgi:hypothetical protein
MKVLIPITVDDDVLTEKNVAEDDAAEWASGTTYADEARVIVIATHSVYESLQAANTGNDPTDAASAWWVRVMATKPYRAFDKVLSAPVTVTGDIRYIIQPLTLTRSVALVGVSAATARCRILAPNDTVLLDVTQQLADYSEIIDALTMVTVEPSQKEVAVFEDVICTPGNRVNVTIGDGTGEVSVSEVLVGDTLNIGVAKFGTEIGIQDFSQFDEDQFGNVSITKRGYRDRTTFQVAVQTLSLERLRRKLASLRATFALYYHTADGEAYGTTVYGRYKSLDMNVSGPNVSDLDLEVEGVINNDA